MPKPNPIQSPEGEAVNAFVTEMTQMLSILYERWQDEREYEDIADYALPLEVAAAKHGLKIIKMNKRPFGCNLAINSKTYRAEVNSRSIGWKRLT